VERHYEFFLLVSITLLRPSIDYDRVEHRGSRCCSSSSTMPRKFTSHLQRGLCFLTFGATIGGRTSIIAHPGCIFFSRDRFARAAFSSAILACYFQTRRFGRMVVLGSMVISFLLIWLRPNRLVVIVRFLLSGLLLSRCVFVPSADVPFSSPLFTV